jgi:hypothetical protein
MNRYMGLLMIALALVSATQTNAAPILFGDVAIGTVPPLTPNFRPGQNPDDSTAFLISEAVGIPAPAFFALPPGTLIDVWLIHSDAVAPPTQFQGIVRFDRLIVDVAATPVGLRLGDLYLAANGGAFPALSYMGAAHPAFAFRGLEGPDAFVIGPGPFGPRAIGFNVFTGNVIDEIRVSTLSTVPEPGTFLLLGAGLLGIALLRRRIGNSL